MLRKYLFMLFGLCISLSAQAVTPEPRAMACMMYFRSDAVFVGQVIATSAVQEKDDNGGGWVYTLKVVKSYKGADQPTLDVFTADDSSRLPLKDGKQYLLFASKEGGLFTIGYDRLSGELPAAKQALKDLDKILARKPGDGGDIYARVVRYPFGDYSGGVAGVHITVQGEKGKFEASTNGKGWIHLHVPAGKYSASAAATGLSFKPYDLSWDNPDHFSVPGGGCAEIQIQADPAER